MGKENQGWRGRAFCKEDSRKSGPRHRRRSWRRRGDGPKGPRGLFPGGKRSEAMNMDRQPSDLPVRALLTLVHAVHKGKWGHVLNFSSGRETWKQMAIEYR